MTEKTADINIIHRLSAGFKLLVLCLCSIALFFMQSPYLTAAFMLIIAGLYPLANFSPLKIFQVLRPLWWVIALTAVFLFFTAPWPVALNQMFRLITLVLLAALVTLTTSSARMLETFERLFQPLRFIGINPAKVSLTLSLTLRFIPVFQQVFHEVREAQKARGLERSIIALVIPVTVRMFKMSDDIAAAIIARGYE